MDPTLREIIETQTAALTAQLNAYTTSITTARTSIDSLIATVPTLRANAKSTATTYNSIEQSSRIADNFVANHREIIHEFHVIFKEALGNAMEEKMKAEGEVHAALEKKEKLDEQIEMWEGKMRGVADKKRLLREMAKVVEEAARKR